MEGVWPSTVEGWTTIVANLATALGVFTIFNVLRVNLSASVHFQRRTALAQEAILEQSKTDPAHTDPKNYLLNTVMLWAEAQKKYVDGVAPDEFGRMATAERRAYILWVSRLISALDIAVFHDGNPSNAVQSKVAQTLAEHASALTTGWPFHKIRYPVSDAMSRLIMRTLDRHKPH